MKADFILMSEHRRVLETVQRMSDDRLDHVVRACRIEAVAMSTLGCIIGMVASATALLAWGNICV